MIESATVKHRNPFLEKLGYVFVASLCHSHIIFFGYFKLFECVSAILVPLVLFMMATRSIKLRLYHTDIAVLAFVFFSLTSVSTGMESLYESARYYREMVLVPAVVYFLTRALFIETRVLNNSILVVVLISCLQVIFIVTHYIKVGERPVGAFGVTNLITTSMLVAIGIFYMSSSIRRIENGLLKVILVLGLLLMFLGLVISMTRTTLLGVLIILPIMPLVLKKIALQRLFLFFFVVGTVLLLLVSFVSYDPSRTEAVEKRNERTIERFTTYEPYVKDAKLRLNVWGYILQNSMEHPMFGHGGFAYRLGAGGISSAHNIFVSSVLTSGIFGLTILISLTISAYFAVFSVHSERPTLVSLRNLISCSLTMMIMIGFTNDFTGGRVALFFWLIGLSASLPELSRDELRKEQRMSC